MRHRYLWRLRPPESSLRGNRVCVAGQISNYDGKPEVVLVDPSQVTQ